MYLLKHGKSISKDCDAKIKLFPIMIEPVKDYRSSFPVKKNKPIINNVRPRYSSQIEKTLFFCESKAV